MRTAAKLLLFLTVMTLPAGAVAQTPDGRIVPVPASLQVNLGAAGPKVLIASLPPDATGTVQFRLDDTPIGGPVPVAGGTARSEPVNIPQRQSVTLRMDYSGDERYQPVAAITHADYRPEETPEAAGQPEPAPAAKRPRTLPRTGIGFAATASAAAVLLLAGLTIGRRRQLDPLGVFFRSR